jgi:hypothetical protein
MDFDLPYTPKNERDLALKKGAKRTSSYASTVRESML